MIKMHNSKNGFTIIELTLAMAFISVLLLSVVFVAIQAGRIYNRGMILRTVNQSGRDIDANLRRDFLQSDSRQISQANNDSSVIDIRDGGDILSSRFCLGRYSYLWNSPKALDEKINSQSIVTGPDGQPVNFVRVIDENGSLCQANDGKYINQLTDNSKITNLLKVQSSQNDIILAIHSLTVMPIAKIDGSPEALYRVQYTIGTSKLSEINTSDKSCKPPQDNNSNFEFCAINQFDTIVRTNG